MENLDIDLGDSVAMNNLGYNYQKSKNYVEMEKYYLIAIELGNSTAMFNLGFYHEFISGNDEEMEKYYLMAIDLGHSDAMKHLGRHHHYITKDYTKMEKYYLMAIDVGDSRAIYNLLDYCHAKTSSVNDGEILLFEILTKHYDATENPTDAFLATYYELINAGFVKQHILSQIKECLGRPNKTFVYLYETYIRNPSESKVKEPSSCFATDFKIHAIQTKEEEETTSLTYPVHSVIFNSDYFHHLIDSDAFSHATEVSMYVSSFGMIDLLLKCLYLSELDYENATDAQIQELYGLADQYALEDLRKACKYILLKRTANV